MPVIPASAMTDLPRMGELRAYLMQGYALATMSLIEG